MYKLKRTFYPLLILVFASACSIKKDQVVDTTFDKYVDQFFQEAQDRGNLINKSDFDFSIEFGETPHAGVCRRPGNDITINESVWKDYGERDRENLIFHELGHCILKRPHENVLLENGECKSIMKGTEDNRSCFKNRMSGLWREYYIDELFDINTTTPDWYVSEIPTTVTDSLIRIQMEIGSLTSRQFPGLEENQNFEIKGSFVKGSENTWIQIAFGEVEFIFRNNNVLISRGGDMIYFNSNWSTFFETTCRIVYKDDFVYYLLDGEMFHIDERTDESITYMQITTNAKDLNQKIEIDLSLFMVE